MMPCLIILPPRIKRLMFDVWTIVGWSALESALLSSVFSVIATIAVSHWETLKWCRRESWCSPVSASAGSPGLCQLLREWHTAGGQFYIYLGRNSSNTSSWPDFISAWSQRVAKWSWENQNFFAKLKAACKIWLKQSRTRSHFV